jgi:hypothetical protein
MEETSKERRSELGRRMSPPRHLLEELRTSLTPGEREVLDRLDEELPDDWEIYLQPHLNGCRPDFILMSPRRGIAILEIKDWTSVEPFALEAAIAKMQLYETEVEELYCPTLNERAGAFFPSLSAKLVLTRLTRQMIRDAAPQLSLRKVVCADELADVTKMVPGARVAAGAMAAAVVDDMRSWLEEPRCSREQRYPLLRELNSKQRALVGESAGASGLRRIKGTAGAGKSLVLAARAAHLAKYEQKRGLVTSFNLTLLHYLRDLAVRYPLPERNALVNRYVTWLHFHGWCKRICVEAGLAAQYAALWKGDDVERVFGSDLALMTREALEIVNPEYDFILVDEGQDWQLEWWRTLQAALRPGGEMMLVADRTQDLYGQRSKWTDEAMTGAGFRGPWTSLDTSYRLPPAIIPQLRSFASDFIRTDVHLPEPDAQTTLERCRVEWVNVSTGGEAYHCADAVARLHRGDLIGERVSPPDIILLVQDHRVGQRCVAELNERGYAVCHTFSEDRREGKRLKQAFFRGDSRIKATTYNSFKGFENTIVVVVITSARFERDFRGIYAALTRVKRAPDGSALVVVNSTKQLREYGESWATTYPPGSE